MFSTFQFIESVLFSRTSVKVLVVVILARESQTQNWSASKRKQQRKEDEKGMSNVDRIFLKLCERHQCVVQRRGA